MEFKARKILILELKNFDFQLGKYEILFFNFFDNFI